MANGRGECGRCRTLVRACMSLSVRVYVSMCVRVCVRVFVDRVVIQLSRIWSGSELLPGSLKIELNYRSPKLKALVLGFQSSNFAPSASGYIDTDRSGPIMTFIVQSADYLKTHYIPRKDASRGYNSCWKSQGGFRWF